MGDVTFLEDGIFAEANGEIYTANRAFFLNLVDSMALEEDLVDLRARNTQVTRIEVVEPREDETPKRMAAREESTAFWVRWLNTLVLPLALIVLGVGLFFTRRMSKNRFVRSLDN